MKKLLKSIVSGICSAALILGWLNVPFQAGATETVSDTQAEASTQVSKGIFNGHTYAVYDEGVTWFEAKLLCEQKGAHLVTITSAAEQKAVEELISSGKKLQYWMGMDLYSSKQWITGEACSYTNWDQGEPNECTRDDGNHEYYVHIYNKSNPAVRGSQRFKWNDMYYDNTFPGEEAFFSVNNCGFICEWDDEITYFAQITYNNMIYNLLSQPITITKGAETKTNIKINYDGDTENKKFYLTQNTATAIELENKVEKTIQPGKEFEPGKDIYVLVVDEETGEAEANLTALKVADPTATGAFFPESGIEGMNFKLGKEVAFTIPDSVAVFGGAEIKWDFGFIPVCVEYDREDCEKLNVVFGTNLVTVDENGVKAFKDFDFEAYKKSVKKAASKGSRSLKQLRNDFKMSNAQKVNLFGGKVLGGGTGSPSFETNIAGYAEMKVINGEFQFIEGQLCAEAEISYTYDGQLFIWAVPLCYEIGVGFGGGLEGKMINLIPESFVPEFEAYLNTKVKGIIGAGVGISKVASVGASGNGSLNLKSALDRDYMKIWSEGQADFHVKLLGKKVAEKIWAKGSFLIYETGNEDSLVQIFAETPPATKALLAGVDTGDTYENESRDYLSEPTLWYSDTAAAWFRGNASPRDLRLQAENVYTESAPLLCEIDGQLVMVMLWDDEIRADIDRTMLVWSVFDEEYESWSEPQPVFNDGTADFYPSFRDGWIVWQNQKTVMDDSMTLEEIAALGEICAAEWNGEGFAAPVSLTNDVVLDTLPTVCADGDQVTVVWVTNEENDILGVQGDNSIRKATFDNEWKITTVCSGINAVTSLSVGGTGADTCIAWSVHGDDNLLTIDDCDIYLAAPEPVLLTDNDVIDSNPIIAGNALYYYSGGNIVSLDLKTNTQTLVLGSEIPGLTDDFSVATGSEGQCAILWTSVAEEGTELFCALNEDGVWSERIQLSEIGCYVRYPSGVLSEDQSLYTAFSAATWADGTIERNDLYTLKVIPSFDLALENVYVDETEMKFYGTIQNTGERTVPSCTVTLLDWDGENNQYTCNTPLKPGAGIEFEIAYLIPENMDCRGITLRVDADDAEEYNDENNECSFEIGFCDIEVEDIADYEKIPVSSTSVTIANKGFAPTDNVTVYLREKSRDGKIVAQKNIRDISPGEKVVLTFEYDVTENDSGLWYVTATTNSTEATTTNNESYFVNDRMLKCAPYSGRILRCETSQSGADVYYCVENNTSDETSPCVLLAIYGANGEMKSVAVSSLSLTPYSVGTSCAEFNSYIRQDGDYIRMFCLNTESGWAPISEATSDMIPPAE